MKLIIHITRFINTIEEGDIIYNEVLKHFTSDPLFHVNAIADHNFKHPEGPDTDQTSNPYAGAKEDRSVNNTA